MVRKINDPAQLPAWFSIGPYKWWSDVNPEDAAQAIDNHVAFLHLMRVQDLNESDISIGLKWLRRCAEKPFERFGVEPTAEMWVARRKAYLEEHHPEELDDLHELDRQEELIDAEGSRIAREVAAKYFDPEDHEVSKVNLWDVMQFLAQNESLIAKVDELALLVAEEHGLDVEDVQNAAYRNIKVNDGYGVSFIKVDGYPSAEIVSEQLKRFVLENHAIAEVPYPRAGASEVRKLFDYRVAAYIDLKIWERLTNSEITKKCMAVAMFPEGEYGELDLNPSRTVGKFLNRVVNESGYMDSLIAKASQLDNLG